MKRIRVVTSDMPLSELKLPFPLEKLERVRAQAESFVGIEEMVAFRWIQSVQISDMPRPIDEERAAEIEDGARTRTIEDYAMAAWILDAWKAVEAVR